MFLDWNIHPTIARGLFAHWLVAIEAPNVLIVLELVDFLFAKFESEKRSSRGVSSCVFLAYARGGSGLVVRPLV